jgi:hypothetical protein
MEMVREEEEEEEERERKGGEEEEGRRRRKGDGAQNAQHDAGGDGVPRRGYWTEHGLMEGVLDWTAWEKQQAPLRRTRATSRRGKGRPDDDGEEEAIAGWMAAARGLFLVRACGLLLLDNGHMLVMSVSVCAAWWCWERGLAG